MKHHTTQSILQRVPVILAVTAASYGLPTQARDQGSNVVMRHSVSSATYPSPTTPEREIAIPRH